MMARISPRAARWIVVALVILGAAATVVVYDRLARARPAPYFESDEDHFLHGSIGGESAAGVPYWIWLVLPRIFPDLLPGPGGYASLGMVWSPGYDLPIGLSKATIGYSRVAVNCAFCHTASVRARPDDLPVIVPGAPAHQTAAQQYVRFLAAAASDPRFNASNILGEIARNYRLSAVDRLLYRFVVIPVTRQRLLRLKNESGWMNERPDWGPGRADVFSSIKFHRLGRTPDTAIGSADMMALWNARGDRSRGLFWDGLNTSLHDAVVTSALSAGSSRPWLDADMEKRDRTDAREMSSLQRIEKYISSLRAPRYPFPIDQALAARGAVAFAAECAQCHSGTERQKTDTDPNRRNVWTQTAAVAYATFSDRRSWQSPRFNTADDYVPLPLDGVWLRAPYLHNGSVPSLRDLLEPAVNRPARFRRGYDVYDPVRVGFVSDGADAQRAGTLHDTTLPGNSNAGHAYGTDLPADSKNALLEYLKTL